MKIKPKAKKIMIIAVSVVAALGVILLCLAIPFEWVSPKPAKVETYQVGDGTNIRVGVMSDSQLPEKFNDEGEMAEYKDHVLKALQLMKAQKVQMIIHAGDICDMASNYGYQTYKKCIEKVYPDEKTRPVFLNIMGNHDTWFNTDWKNAVPKHRMYQIQMGESPWVHKVVNGIHFIGASPDQLQNTNGYSKKVANWLDEQIELAEKDAKAKGLPVFVITHHNLQDTVYGSDEWSDSNITSVLKKYENVVSISGHSHYSILDERSIYQGELTAFTTQSLAYVEMERGKFDAFQGKTAAIPPKSTDVQIVSIMNVGKDKTTIERYNVQTQKEEKADQRWTLEYPLVKGNFTYRNDVRASAATPPVFPADAIIQYTPAIASYRAEDNGSTLPGITFTAATHPDLVHSYNVRLTNTSTGDLYTYTYFSDFYLGVENMAKTVDMALDPQLPTGKYKVEVYAIESFGRFSEKPLVLPEMDWQQQEAEEDATPSTTAPAVSTTTQTAG